MPTSQECYPFFHALGDSTPDTVISSGCGLDGNGNIACDPEAMRADAEAQLNQLGYSGSLSLTAYTLSRYMQAEVGGGSLEERVAVGEAAVNRANTTGLSSVNDLLLYRQGPGHPNYGFYGPIHGGTFPAAPYGRWASTSQDPTLLTLLLAQLVDGGDTVNFSDGADDQDGLEYTSAFPDPAAYVRQQATKGNYWVGPLPGVDYWRTFLWRHYGVTPDSSDGAALMQRGLDAVANKARPTWGELPLCPKPATRKMLYIAGAAGLLLGAIAALHYADRYIPWLKRLP